MGTLMFGNDETITCIQPVDIKGADGESLCLAYKTTKTFVGAGVWIRDDGYTLRVLDDATRYFKVDAAELQKFQAEGLLPTPLPSYHIKWPEYLFGYSLWIIVAGMLVAWRIGVARKRRRLEEDAATVTSYGPPVIETDADRYIQEQVAPLLEAGESVQHQAYALDRDPATAGAFGAARAKACFVVLTNRRLHFVNTRVGALSLLLENKGTETVDRASITTIAVDDRMIVLALADGGVRALWIGDNRKLSNQRAFLRDVPRLVGDQLAKAGAGQRAG